MTKIDERGFKDFIWSYLEKPPYSISLVELGKKVGTRYGIRYRYPFELGIQIESFGSLAVVGNIVHAKLPDHYLYIARDIGSLKDVLDKGLEGSPLSLRTVPRDAQLEFGENSNFFMINVDGHKLDTKPNIFGVSRVDRVPLDSIELLYLFPSIYPVAQEDEHLSKLRRIKFAFLEPPFSPGLINRRIAEYHFG